MQIIIWQFILICLWGVPTLIFVPFLLRNANQDLMASILVSQVYANYLGLIVQFGFAWSGPAAAARAERDSVFFQFWEQSIFRKAQVYIATMVLIGLGCLIGNYYIIFYSFPLFAQVLNSNWFLQAKGNYSAGVLFSLVGVGVGGVIVIAQNLSLMEMSVRGFLIVSALMSPQIAVAIGSYWLVRTMRQNCSSSSSKKKIPEKDLKVDIFFVTSQLLWLFSSTAGTLVTSFFANADITAAYAATEKLFNLAANGLQALFMGVFPRLASSFHQDKGLYVRNVKRILYATTALSTLVLFVVYFDGEYWFKLYLGSALGEIIQPALAPFAIWFMLCIVQNLLTAHLVLVDRRGMVLWVQGVSFIVTAVVGLIGISVNPLFWVYGMIGGQIFGLFVLARLYLNSVTIQRMLAHPKGFTRKK